MFSSLFKSLWQTSTANSASSGQAAPGSGMGPHGRVATFPKISLGCGACHQFVRGVHRDGVDRGAIASFGNGFAIEQPFGWAAGEVSSGLISLERKVLSGRKEGTALYDSVVQMAETVGSCESADDRRRLGLLLIVTDGADQHSRRFAESPAKAGLAYRRILAGYSKPWVTLLFGVGKDVNKESLAELALAGEMVLHMVDDMTAFASALAELGTQIRVGVRTDCVAQGRWAVAVQRPFAAMSVTPYDYVFLIDRSGSMQDAG